MHAGKNAWTHEVVSQGIRLARASQKAVVKEVPLNSISGCPTIKPSFDDFGAVWHRNQFKAANAGVQFDRMKKVNVIRDKQISDSTHQRDFERCPTARRVEYLQKLFVQSLLRIFTTQHIAIPSIVIPDDL